MVKLRVLIISLLVFNLKMVAQNEAIAFSEEDRRFCQEYRKLKIEETGTHIWPDHIIESERGNIDSVLQEIKTKTLVHYGHLDCFRSLYVDIVVDTNGVVRGGYLVKKVSSCEMEAARYIVRLFQKEKFIPASIRGRKVVYDIPFLIKNDSSTHNGSLNVQDSIASEDIGTRWSYESMPSFDHDRKQKKLYKLINENLAQFDTLTKTETVYVRFLVDTLGATHQHKVMKGVNPQLDEEALRVCRLIRFDNPAMQGGKPAETFYTVPIRFEPPQAQPITKKRCVFWRKKKK